MSNQVEVKEDTAEAGPSQPGVVVAVATGMGLLLLLVIVGVVAQPFVQEHKTLVSCAAGVVLLLGYLAGIITNATLRARWVREHAAVDPEMVVSQRAAARFEKFVLPLFALALTLPLIALPLVAANVPKPEQHGWELRVIAVSFGLIVVGLLVRSLASPPSGGDGNSRMSAAPQIQQDIAAPQMPRVQTPADRASAIFAGIVLAFLAVAFAWALVAVIMLQGSALQHEVKLAWQAVAVTSGFVVVGIGFAVGFIAEAIMMRRHRVPVVQRTVIDKPVMS